ncbi:MAG: cystathionine beta-lyase [Pelagibacterales bacterium]|nr:cystathionine beta-lyase [Pelagibacterales bacterium]PPR16264.1 MAG: Cysteine synthase [Alphaproteobacteria bacterium MarineAlpha9_Bin3]|tara:strand:- start:8280 stop:9257 length:978 start_codon:yes stop_codon:yes gene_type:complete
MEKQLTTNSVIDLIGNTPLLEVMNIDTGTCKLFLKLESQNPGGSIKDRPAKFMIDSAEKNGDLKKGGLIIEATAGNTGIGLALIAQLRGYKCLIVVPDKMAKEKIIHLEALGAEVVITRSDVEKGHPEYYADLAQTIANKNNGSLYINQFGNNANLKAHYEWTGPEILDQLSNKVDAFCAGVGTGGTITGVGKALKEVNKNCDIILADPLGSILEPKFKTGVIPDSVGSWLVEGIGEDYIPPLLDFPIITHAYAISDKEALDTCNMVLKKEGVLSGSSSGTLIAAAIKYCREQTEEKNVVTLVCDTGNKYLKIYDKKWLIENKYN